MLRFRDMRLFICPMTPTGSSLVRLAPFRYAALAITHHLVNSDRNVMKNSRPIKPIRDEVTGYVKGYYSNTIVQAM